MKCWNCLAEVSDNAKWCPDCEADLSDMPPADAETVELLNKWLSELPEDSKALLQQYMESSETADEFANAIMVGPCVVCQSQNVGNCENDPDYDDITLGRCFDCGAVWCTECDYVLGEREVACPRAEEHEAEAQELFPDPGDDDAEESEEDR